jgi:hypothetical protein
VAYIWFKSISSTFRKGSAMIRDASDFNHVPTTTEPEWTGETVAGYRVHPAAAMFPLMYGQEFDDLVTSIAESGLAVPVETYNGLLTDGRNRARAVETLRAGGLDVDLPVTEWRPRDGETVEEHIYRLNVTRRHLTDDQRAVLATALLPRIRAERAARQEASRFSAASPAGDPAAQISEPPTAEPSSGPRSSQVRFQTSTTGCLSELANVSRHKATLAIGLADDVAAGLVPRDEMNAVIRGDIPLRKAGRRPARKDTFRRKAAPVCTEAAGLFDDAPEPIDEPIDEPSVSEEEVLRRWESFKELFAISEHRELRRLMAVIITSERLQFDC